MPMAADEQQARAQKDNRFSNIHQSELLHYQNGRQKYKNSHQPPELKIMKNSSIFAPAKF